MNHMDNFSCERKPLHATTKFTSLAVSINGAQRRVLVRMHCVYCGMLKGTPLTEATSNIELKMKPVALAIVKLGWSESNGYLVS